MQTIPTEFPGKNWTKREITLTLIFVVLLSTFTLHFKIRSRDLTTPNLGLIFIHKLLLVVFYMKLLSLTVPKI